MVLELVVQVELLLTDTALHRIDDCFKIQTK